MQRLREIFTLVTAGVGDQLRLRRLSVEMVVRIQWHLEWIRRRLASALIQAEAGKPPRPSRPRPPRDAEAPARKPPTCKPYIRKLPLPRREAWLIPLVPPVYESRYIAAACGTYLRLALAEPEMVRYLTHPSVVRALRPICRMLGISDALPPKPPRPKPVGRISEAQSATATAPAEPGTSPTGHPPSEPTPKPRPVRRIPPHRLRLPLPRSV